MTEAVKQTLIDGLAALGLTPDPQAADRLALYCDRLLEKNQVMNLTAITEPGEVVTRHFLDSAALLVHQDLHGKRVIDVGTGAGFPGLVLKIVDPSIQLTLLDTLGKRVDWLSEVCEELGLSDTECLKGRAEEVSRQKQYRDRYDAAVSRAVASMTMLSELCLPYVRPGGVFLAMKSSKSDEEVQAAGPILAALGGTVPTVTDYLLPGTELSHRLVTVRKSKATPKVYPRKWTKIKEGKI